MKFNVNEIRKVMVQYEPNPVTPPPTGPTGPTGPTPPPPTGPTPPPPPMVDPPWNEEPDGDERGGGEGGGGIKIPPGGGGGGGEGEATKPKLVSKKIDTIEGLEGLWKKLIEEAKSKHGGDLPGEMMRAIEKLLGVKINWTRELKRMINSLSSKTDYSVPNRRFLSTGVQWGVKKRNESFESLVVIADTSGSVSEEELTQFVTEAMGVIEEFSPKETYLIWCDSTVYEPVEIIKSGQAWNYKKAYGGGGTSFIPPVAWIEENIIKKGKKLGPVLFFTDGYPNSGPNGGWPKSEEYSIKKYVNKFFWIIIGKGSPAADVKVPFGRRIDLIM